MISKFKRDHERLEVGRRRFDEESAAIFGVRKPLPTAQQWFAGFRPEARLSLEVPPAEQSTPELPFPALELGPVIGKGSFGYVCRGALGYLIVAVKASRPLQPVRAQTAFAQSLKPVCQVCERV